MRARLIPRILVAGVSGAAAVVVRMGGSVLVVGLDDALDEIVADDVPFIKVREGDTFDLADNFDGFDQAGAARFG